MILSIIEFRATYQNDDSLQSVEDTPSVAPRASSASKDQVNARKLYLVFPLTVN
jgi:hypothetical protein